jgi:hypothetical protein
VARFVSAVMVKQVAVRFPAGYTSRVEHGPVKLRPGTQNNTLIRRNVTLRIGDPGFLA